MSQETDYGSELDDVIVSVQGEHVYMTLAPEVPFSRATFLDSSQGSGYAPLPGSIPSSPVSSDDPPSDGLETLQLAEGTPTMTRQEHAQAVIDEMRAKCMSVRSDKTSRRSEHEDGPALARAILAKLKTTTKGWCVLSTAVDTGRGYSQVSYGGANHFATLQECVLWASGNAKPASGEKADPYDVSHLCDERQCTVPSHVTVESKAANNSRKGCKAAVRCSSACRKCNGRKDIFICEHDPRCVRFREGYDTFEEYLENGICEDRWMEPVMKRLRTE